MTVLEAIQRSAGFLEKKGVESPRLQAELLLAHLLKLPRMKLYLNFERVLAAAETDALRGCVVRRGQREPLQHITGSVSFCGLDIAVDRRVLVPRPETELLAEAAWQWLAQRGPGATALDYGTGSGCIAIAVAMHCPEARIVALDVSVEALTVAQGSAQRHGVDGRVDFRHGTGLAELDPSQRFDLIVSNPPYIATAEIATLEPEVRDHDPRVALDGGADGLDCYRSLAAAAGPYLKPDGRLMLEFGDGQAGALTQLLEARGWSVESIHQDYQQCPRFLSARRAAAGIA
jgi:release factor glutamine methyltransferase